MKFKKIIYANKFDGLPKESDFKIVEEDLGDDLKDNGEYTQLLTEFILPKTTYSAITVLSNMKTS